MSGTELTPITSYNANGERAPEACVIAEKLQDAGIDAQTPLTGDHVLYVADDDLDENVRQMLSESHYTEGLPRTATSADNYTGFRPKSGWHPDQ